MFHDPLDLLGAFWAFAGVVVAGYLGLFMMARRPVSLRPRRLGLLAVLVLSMRLGLAAFGYPLVAPWDCCFIILVVFVAVGLLAGGRNWFFRAEAAVVREQVQMACGGLFLEYAEIRPGRFELKAKAGARQLNIMNVSTRIQLVALPVAVAPGKVALLVQWLSKQYPGPVPRIRIILKKE